MPAPPTSFDEIRAVVAALPAADPLTAGLGLSAWLAHAQRRADPELLRPRLALFAASHGIAAATIDGDSQALATTIAALVDGGSAFHDMVTAADADLRLYELALDQPTADAQAGAAMSETEAAHAIAYGMMAVETGIDLLVLSALGSGSAMAAAAIGLVLFGGPPEDWTSLHTPAVAAAAARHRNERDPLKLLAALGGPDIAAILGVILAAKLAGVPVLLDGPPALAAGALVRMLRGDTVDHCRPAASDPKSGAGFAGALRMIPVLEIAAEPPLTGAKAILGLRVVIDEDV